MSDVILGKILEGDVQRDAIHIAIIPAFSDECLNPGQHVGLIGQKVSAKVEKKIGIVDPFLTNPVMPGQQFYLCLYQNSITGMRHDWMHPMFPTFKRGEYIESTSYSEQWLREFAEEVGVSYRKLLEDAEYYADDPNYYTILNYDTPDCVYEKQEEFWKHFTNVTGLEPPKGFGTFYRCAC